VSRRGLIVTLVVSGALVGFVVWLPARFFDPLLPPDLRCSELGGSVWAGRCEGLSIRGSRSGTLHWQIERPLWQPLRANVGFVWTPRSSESDSMGAAGVRGELRATLDGRVAVYLSSVQLPLQTLRDALPADVTLGPIAAVAGRLESRGLLIELDGRSQLTALRGTVSLRDTRLLRYDAAIGDFDAELSGVVGRIKDRGGPLKLAGEARLTEPGTYTATLRVIPRITGVLPALPGGSPLEISVDGRL